MTTPRRHKSLDLEWLNLEAIYEGIFDNSRAHSVGEYDFYRRSSARQFPINRVTDKAEEESPTELLRCLLVAKDVLQKKNKDPSAAILAAIEMSQDFEREHSTTQQLTLKRQTLIRQRKNSTAIKVASLEKRRSLNAFKEGEKESLERRLTALDLELKENERVAEVQRKRLFTRHNSDISAIRDLGGIEMIESESKCGAMKSAFHRGSLPSLNALPSFAEAANDKKRLFGFFERRKTTRPERRFKYILDSKIWKNRRQKSSDNVDSNSSRSPVTCHSNLDPDAVDEDSKPNIRTKINPEALQEIEKFKNLISKSLIGFSDIKYARLH